jgi:hypothetical protein
MTLAVGHNASLLCRVWCHPEGTSGACEHQEPTASPSLAGKDSCNGTFGAVAFVREDVRRGTSTTGGANAAPIPAFRFAPAPAHRRPGHDSGQQPLTDARPLVTPLRI